MSKTTSQQTDYQQLSDELEAILAKLQDEQLSIDAALPAYERGLELVKQLEAYLQTAENRVVSLQAKQAE